MKLNQKVEVIQMPAVKIARRDAEKKFAHAINSHFAYVQHLQAAKKAYVNCCFDFYISRFAFSQGEWGAHCELYNDKVSVRTIQRRIEDAEIMITYARTQFPELKTLEEIRAKYNELPLPAVRAMVQDMRDCGVARKFGEYFAEDYQDDKKKKLLGDGQMEFSWEKADKTLDTLLGKKIKFVFPAGVDEDEALRNLAYKLETAHRNVIAEIEKRPAKPNPGNMSEEDFQKHLDRVSPKIKGAK